MILSYLQPTSKEHSRRCVYARKRETHIQDLVSTEDELCQVEAEVSPGAARRGTSRRTAPLDEVWFLEIPAERYVSHPVTLPGIHHFKTPR